MYKSDCRGIGREASSDGGQPAAFSLSVPIRSGNLTILRVAAGSPERYLKSVLKRVRNESYDLIQIDNRPQFVGPIKRLFPQTPVSLFLHSLTFVSSPLISRKRAVACLSKADLIVANSGSLKEELARRFPAVADKLSVVWLGVDSSRFQPPDAKVRSRERKRFRLGSSFTVLYVGRIIPQKGIPVLMRAVRMAERKAKRPIRSLIAGGGPKAEYRAYLQNLAGKLKLRTRFLGRVPHHRIHRIYRAADCFACPSQGHEAFGLVNVEAMASGIPVIAADNGGIKEIIQDGKSGLLVKKYRSPQGYARHILRLMESPEKARTLGEDGRSSVLERFSWSMTAAKLEELYTGAVYPGAREVAQDE
ncbi:glycosyltransferase family 4 protein [Paenibacillus sp. P25]|nr:glycosyltransferase family 4 protein [Paenibacillus sp. P25]